MTPKQLIKFYRTQVAAAEAAGVTQPAVSNWLRRGKIPELRQLKIQNSTGGQLVAGKDILAASVRKVSHA